MVPYIPRYIFMNNINTNIDLVIADHTYMSRRGHFQRALEEAVQTHMSQWPSLWNGKNPLHGGGNFAKMSAAERVCFLMSRRLLRVSTHS